MKRILVMASTFPRWEGDTVPPFVFELSDRLAHSGYEMHVLAPHTKGAQARERLGSLNVHRFRYAPSRMEKVAYGGGILENLRQHPALWGLVPTFFAAQIFATWRLSIRYRFDLLHVHWLIPQGLSAAVVPPWPSAPRLLTAHGADVFVSRSALRKSIVKFVAGRHSVITVNSSAMRDALGHLTGTSAQVIPMGIDTDRFSYVDTRDSVSEGDANQILFVGRLAEKKGVEYLIRAMPEIKAAVPGATLTIVGDGPRLELLKKEAALSGVDDSIHFAGALPNSELPEFYRRANVFVAPSVVGKNGDTEALGVVLLEAAGCGLPVVATNVGGISDVVRNGETGILVDEKSPQQIASAVVSLLRDPARARFMGDAARRSVIEQFSWTNVAARFAKLYDNLISPSADPMRTSQDFADRPTEL